MWGDEVLVPDSPLSGLSAEALTAQRSLGDSTDERCPGTPWCVLSEQFVCGSECLVRAVAGGALRWGRLWATRHILSPGLVPRPPGHCLLSILITRVNCRDNNAATNVSGESASAGLNQLPSLNMN